MKFKLTTFCLAGCLCAALAGVSPGQSGRLSSQDAHAAAGAVEGQEYDSQEYDSQEGEDESGEDESVETLAAWNETLNAAADGKPATTNPCPKKAPKKKPGNPAQTAYKGVFYDNDFKYLDDSQDKTPCYFGDAFKQRSLHCWLVDVGGEYRARHMNEVDLRGSTLLGLDDDFLLSRTRLYTNARYQDWFRFYGEAIDAVSNFENGAPRNIEENRFDALNLFADLRLYHAGDGALWVRGGRQELLYGEQRLISPLDWANTRRTFDGVKLFWRSPDWDVDGFWTRPVLFPQHLGGDTQFDHPDLTQEFIGLYATYKGKKDHLREFYFLRLADYVAAPSFDANLFGTHWKGKQNDLLYEVEGGYQFGEFGAATQSAGFLTGGLGRALDQHPWKPVLWVYYDWASGDATPGDGRRGTFNQYFPLVHKYFGFTDLVARQNIRDFNIQLTAKPSDKSNIILWWHLLHLDQARDFLYNAPGVPIRGDATGAAGRYVGQNLDFQWQRYFTPRQDLALGYSHFFGGDFIKNTNPPGVTGNAGLYYAQYSWKF